MKPDLIHESKSARRDRLRHQAELDEARRMDAERERLLPFERAEDLARYRLADILAIPDAVSALEDWLDTREELKNAQAKTAP